MQTEQTTKESLQFAINLINKVHEEKRENLSDDESNEYYDAQENLKKLLEVLK